MKAATWEGLHVGELADAFLVAPCREAAGGVQIRLPRAIVVGLGGEEFQDTPWQPWAST